MHTAAMKKWRVFPADCLKRRVFIPGRPTQANVGRTLSARSMLNNNTDKKHKNKFSAPTGSGINILRANSEVVRVCCYFILSLERSPPGLLRLFVFQPLRSIVTILRCVNACNVSKKSLVDHYNKYCSKSRTSSQNGAPQRTFVSIFLG